MPVESFARAERTSSKEGNFFALFLRNFGNKLLTANMRDMNKGRNTYDSGPIKNETFCPLFPLGLNVQSVSQANIEGKVVTQVL